MAITLPSGFRITNNEPGDSRVVVANQSARLGFSAANVYKGMLVFQQDTQELYTLINNASPSVNSSWIKLVTAETTNQYSGSFSGSFQGDGSGLVIPAGSITGLNLSRTATGSVTASVNIGATSFTVESGSSTLMTVNSDGRIAVSKSINAGVPNLNPWGSGLNGSYFNNFNASSDVSDILRFIAGLLSASAPDAAPNTRTWNSGSTTTAFSIGGTTAKSSYMSGVLGGSTTYTNARLSQQWNQSNNINLGLTGSYRSLQSYLIGKGWMNSSETGSQTLHDVGTHPFGISTYGTNIPATIYNTFGTFTFNLTSVAAGTTTFSSSIGSQAFGLGGIQNAPSTPKSYSLSILFTQSFSDTASVTTPDVTSTYSTSSNPIYTINTVATTGDANGLYLGIIQTGNALIPNAFQDARFASTPAGFTTRKWGISGTNGNVTSSIGYYRLHGLSVALSSSLLTGYNSQSLADTANGFYMPSLSTLGVSNIVQTDPTALISSNTTIASFTATSRSLSGAPYLLTTAYTINYSTDVSKSFDPCYGYSTTPIATSKTDAWSTVGSTSLTNTSVSVTTAGIQTSTTTAGVFPAGGNPSTRRSTNDIPAIGDLAFLSSSFTFSLTANTSSVVQSKATQESTNYNLSFTTTGRNWKDTSTTSTSATVQFYDATRFGQPSTSGSMAIFSRAQGYDNRVLTTRTESFQGETYRLKINNNLLSGSWANGTKFTTSSYSAYSLDALDLQVKPGYLVRPGGNNGYWLVDDGTEYKYYATAFNSNDSNQINSIILNIVSGSATHLKWNQTGVNGFACLAIFSNSTGLNNAIDVKEDSLSTQVFTAGTNGLNPFTSNITVYKNTAVYPSVGIGTPFLLNGSNQNFVLLFRMRGDVGPITQISYS